MKQHYRLTLLLVLVLLATAVVPLPAVQAQAETGTATPPVGGPGTSFTFQASGFGSSEPVGVWLIQPDGNTRMVEGLENRQFSDPEGNVEWNWTAPEFVPNGQWYAMARGDVTRYEVRIPFRVDSNLGNAPPSSWQVTPTSGPPGTTFEFVGRSPEFIPGEQVGSWFIDPFGNPYNVEQGMSVDPNGQIYRLWKAPEGITGGEWIFRAVGIASGYNIDMRFTIEAPVIPPEPEVPQELTVEPTSGPPGTTFTFTVTGFAGGELVNNWLVRPDGTSFDAGSYIKADGQGVLTWQWTAPPDTPGGEWQWRFRGVQRGERLSIPFFVESAIPVPDETDRLPGTVTPASGPPDTPFFFEAQGFVGGEFAFHWLEDPEGNPVDTEGSEIRANADGTLSWRWDAPYDAMSGQWTMIAKGKVSTLRTQIPFIVEPLFEEQPSGVTPRSGPPTTRFEFFALNFNSGERLDIWLQDPQGIVPDDPAYLIQGRTANRRGRARWSWVAPEEALEGQWTMHIQGRDSRLQYTIPFAINRATPPEEESLSGVTPASGPPGTTFNFYAEGYEERELVGYWLTMPDGTVVRTMDEPDKEADQVVADADGRVEISWTAPEDAPRGTWNLTMRTVRPGGLEEDITYIIYFTIE